jgi:hypothetical protein
MNSTRLKNLLRQAESDLAGQGLRGSESEELLRPGYDLLADTPFWEHQAEGLAVFMSEEVFEHHRVPIALEELAVVARRFHLKPLLPLLTGDSRFFVLALSQKAARLLQCTRYGQSEVQVPDMPGGIADVLRYDDPERQLQLHIGSRSGGRAGVVFHGHGVGKDDEKENIRQYCHAVDRVVYEVLKSEHEPLVLATVGYVHPIYAEANHYPHLLGEGLQGNPDDSADDQLREEAWRLVQPGFARARREAEDLFRQLHGTGRASADPTEVVVAAHDGRVASLFVAQGAHLWGRFDPETREVSVEDESSAGSDDLLDLAAVETLVNGGTVYPVEAEEMPAEAVIAAAYRY